MKPYLLVEIKEEILFVIIWLQNVSRILIIVFNKSEICDKKNLGEKNTFIFLKIKTSIPFYVYTIVKILVYFIVSRFIKYLIAYTTNYLHVL